MADLRASRPYDQAVTRGAGGAPGATATRRGGAAAGLLLALIGLLAAAPGRAPDPGATLRVLAVGVAQAAPQELAAAVRDEVGDLKAFPVVLPGTAVALGLVLVRVVARHSGLDRPDGSIGTAASGRGPPVPAGT